MKNNVSEGLDKVLNIESEYEVIEAETQTSKKPEDFQEIDSDYKYARENLYGVIEKGTEALDTLIELAKASEHPRAFEVVSQLTKTLVDANKIY